MSTKYLLLNPLKARHFHCTTEEVIESLHEFGCKAILSPDTTGETLIYATADRKSVLENMVNEVELNGIIIEYTGIYDQVVEGT
jgi:dihydrodipicolinate synthase/N-acetylneuraminate lyase